MSGRRWLLGSGMVAGALVALLVGGAWVVQDRLDQDALRLRLERAFRHDLGRDLTVQSLRVRLLPVPELEATGIAVADLPGAPRATMLVADRLSAHLDPLALLRHRLRLQGLTLVKPVLLLHRSADGAANWRFTPERGAPGHGSGGPHEHWSFAIGSVRIIDGRLSWTDRLLHRSGTIRDFALFGSGLDGAHPTLFASGNNGGSGEHWTADGNTGPLDRLFGISAAEPSAPWPLRVNARLLDAGGAVLARGNVDGTLSDPAEARVSALTIHAEATRSQVLDGIFPHANLPAITAPVLDATVGESAGPGGATPRPVLRSLTLRTGTFAAAAVFHRRALQPLAVHHLLLRSDGPDQALRIEADGAWRGKPATLSGTLGTLSAWQDALDGSETAAQPVSLQASAGRARLNADGRAGRSGGTVRLVMDVPDWRALAARGPELTALHAEATAELAPGRVALGALQLRSRELDGTGTAAWSRGSGGPPLVTASLTIARADLDALLAGFRTSPTSSPAGTDGVPPNRPVHRDLTAGPTSAPPVDTASVPTATATGTGSRPLPFADLDRADLSFSIKAATLSWRGTTYHDLEAGLSLRNGHAVLDPFTVQGPDGITVAAAEANAADRTVALRLNPALLPAPLLAEASGVTDPGRLAGMVELVTDLHGRGDTEAALLHSLSGTAGLSIVNGTVDGETLSRLVAAPVTLRGAVPLRCLGLAGTLDAGIATLSSIGFDADRLSATGHGTVTLSGGALDLHLFPHLSVGAGGASLPVRIGGTLREPVVTPDRVGPGGRVTLQIGPGAAGPDPCGAVLAAARFRVPGPSPAVSPAKHKGAKAIDFLRGLFGGLGR